MPLFSRARTQEAHWSVDFVEHLRAVHFGLISVSALLIAIGAGKHDAQVAQALTHATEIQQLTSDWRRTQSRIFEIARTSGSLSPESLNFMVRLSIPGPKRQNSMQFLKGVSPLSLLGVNAQDASPAHGMFKDRQVDRDPESLDEFEAIWSKFHATETFGVPRLTDVYPATSKSPSKATCSVMDVPPSASPTEGNPTNIGCEVSWPEDNANVPYASYARLRAPGQWSWISDLGEATKGKERTMTNVEIAVRLKNLKVGGHDLSNYALVLRYPVQELHCDESVFRNMFKDFRTGTFEEAFPELVSATVGMVNLKFPELVSRLKEKQGKGDQNIELIGLKLPSAEITQWGLVLILSIQFYFWLHLHELNKKIDAMSPGWDVAWVGMYTSVAARLTMWITACLLPLTAVFLLSVKVPTAFHIQGHKWTPWVISGAALALSATMAFATAERLERIKSNRDDSAADLPTDEVPSPS